MGACSAEERALVQRWAQREPADALVVEALRVRLAQPWHEFDDTRATELRETLRVRLQAVMQHDVIGGRVSTNEGAARIALRRSKGGGTGIGRGGSSGLGAQALRGWGWTGGVIAVIAGMFFLARQDLVPHTDTAHVYATTAQQQAIINLGDGSRVTLAPQTTLRVQQSETRSRALILDRGEAYFEVAHALAFPFIVQSGGVTAQVLGTAFLVRQAAGDAHVRVAVADGKVRVTNAARVGTRAAGVTLTTGEVVDVTDSTTQVGTADDLTPGTEWAPGHIIFRDTPLATVLRTVSQWYGYHFRYADSTLPTRNVTMVVSTRSSAETLAEIEQVLLVNLAVVGDTVTLVPHPPSSRRNAPRTRTYDVWTPTREVGR